MWGANRREEREGECISSVKNEVQRVPQYIRFVQSRRWGASEKLIVKQRHMCTYRHGSVCKGKWTRLELPGGGELLCSLCSRPAKAVWLLLLKLYLSIRSRRLSTPCWCIALSTLQNACVHWDCFQIPRFKHPKQSQTGKKQTDFMLQCLTVLSSRSATLKW